MGYLGYKPADKPLTSADITDGIIVNADIANSTINLTTKVTGTLPVANGGTGLAALGTSLQVLRTNTGATALEYATLSTGAAAGQVIQVLSATDSTQRTTTSTSYVTASNTLSVTITPSATANKVLVIYSGEYNSDGSAVNIVTLYRGATNLEVSSDSGFRAANVTESAGISIVHLDSPNTTSAVTYQIYFRGNSGTTVRLSNNNRPASITAMEIKG